MKKRDIFAISLMLLLCGGNVPASAAMNLTITPSGDSTVHLQGNGIRDMSSAEVSFDWNATLGEPQVSVQGATVAGIVKNGTSGMTLKIVRDDPDAILDISVGFDNPGDMSRAISNVASSAHDAEGGSYSVPVDFRPADEPLKFDPPSEQTPGTPVQPAGDNTAAQAAASLVEKAVQKSAPPKPGNGVAPDAAPTSSAAGIAEKAANASSDLEALAAADIEPAPGSVLRRFREYRGKKGLKEFALLFGRQDGSVLQEPAVALADGKSEVRLTVELRDQGASAPNFAFIGGTLASLRKSGDRAWEVTVVPAAGTWEGILMIAVGKSVAEFPLTVAPSVGLPNEELRSVTETTFLNRLKKYRESSLSRSRESAPLPEYLSEYIFTANCLAAATDMPEKKPAAARP
jgi:hypothetical protein